MAELSRQSEVTVATIKYYLREGLLPPGEPTGPNQARYGPRHLERLRLVRALREVGGLSVAAIRQVLTALDQPGLDRHRLMGMAHRAVGRGRETPPGRSSAPDRARARTDAEAAVTRLGWTVDPDAPALDQLADVIEALRRVGRPDLVDQLPRYAEAALRLAEWEVRSAAADRDEPAAMMTTVVTGTVLGESLLAAVRLLAHEHVSAQLDRAPAATCPDVDSRESAST